MATSSWKISRRTCLQGLGVSLGLPLLDGMGHGEQKTRPRPRRMCCVYFPFGVAMPKDGTPDRQWGWFPRDRSKWTFSTSMSTATRAG